MSAAWSAASNDTDSNQNESFDDTRHNVTVGVDPIGLNANSWRLATYTNPLPIAYELYPIYSLF